MQVDEPPTSPECFLLEENYGMKFYGLKKTLLLCYEPKIKIITIGSENDLETRNIFLTGATGAGKTCLINALVNHILGVKFEDSYRYVLKDEAGDYQKTSAESQTEYVVGYLIYVCPGPDRMYNYLIVDTPGFKDSRGEERAQEVSQQITTFLQEVDGVDELHCIGFVVNGTIARIQDHFRDIANEFCDVFGKNAKEIIRILISFGHMRRPPVLDVLECSCLKDYRICQFDNASLRDCNQPSDDITEEEIAVSKSFWNKTAKVYNSLLHEVDNVNAVSLLLTRETLEQIKYLHESIDKLKRKAVSYLDLMLDLRLLEDKCREYQTVMTANENWEGTVAVKVRTRLRHLDWWARLRIHAHICEKCMTTCRFPCEHLLGSECPRNGKLCEECSCPNDNHVKSDDVISHNIENRPVIHEDKKALYDEAKNKDSLTLEEISNLTIHIDEQRNKIDESVKVIVRHLDKIKANSLRDDQHSPQEFIEETMGQIKMEKLSDSTESEQRQGHIIPILEDLQVHINAIAGSNGQ